jgi:hypothetical protein
MATWHTIDSARDGWVDAPLDDAQLTELLDVAKDAVLAYGASAEEIDPDAPDTIPVKYRKAQLMQATNVWNSSKVSPGGEFDTGSYGLTTHPLDWQIRQILRPRSVFGGPVA